MFNHIKSFFISHKRVIEDVALIIIIVSIGMSAFGLGRLSAKDGDRPDILLTSAPYSEEAVVDISSGDIVVSIHGSKYHYPWCPGAQAMNEENKIFFETIEEARAAGYTPATNCKGLK